MHSTCNPMINDEELLNDMDDYEREPVEIMAQHADYVSGGVRYCSCGTWCDTGPEAQSTRIAFAHHVLARLALYGYAIAGPPTC